MKNYAFILNIQKYTFLDFVYKSRMFYQTFHHVLLSSAHKQIEIYVFYLALLNCRTVS